MIKNCFDSVKRLLFMLSLAQVPLALAEDTATPITIGERLILPSEVLGETRELLIYRPPGYDYSDKRYHVLYLLDGNRHFHSVTGIVRFLTANSRIPDVMVVAIPNNRDRIKRIRDLTPGMPAPGAGYAITNLQEHIQSNFPTSGGADHFLRFLSDEVIPFVDKHYRTEPHRTLAGHSLGGLFTVHTLLSRPELFTNYIAISPSAWWSGQELSDKTESFLLAHPGLIANLYLSIGNEGKRMLGNAWRLSAALEEQAPESLQWQFEQLASESHSSVVHKSLYQGLEAVYSDWRIPDLAKLVENGSSNIVDAHFERLSEKYGYRIPTPEGIVNQLGYSLLRRQNPEAAIAAFKRNTQAFPKSANTFDSLGDGYRAAGQFQQAKSSYSRAVELAHAASDPALEYYRSKLVMAENLLIKAAAE